MCIINLRLGQCSAIQGNVLESEEEISLLTMWFSLLKVGIRLSRNSCRETDGREKERLSLSLGRTMFIHSERTLSPLCMGDQNVYRRRWDAALIEVEMTPIIPKGAGKYSFAAENYQ